jgi:non-homologous end joining protein Ku
MRGCGIIATLILADGRSPPLEESTPERIDPDMVKLATQLIDRQTGTYDPSDIADKYETPLRALIDAKLKGEGIEDEPMEEPDRGNVVDLMAQRCGPNGRPEEELRTGWR